LEIGGVLSSHDTGDARPGWARSTPEQAEQALRDAEERCQALFNSHDCVYLHDLDGWFLDANQAALDLLGYEREDIPTLNFSSLFDDDQLTVVQGLLSEVKETGVLKTPAELAVRRKLGDHVHVETMATVVAREGKPRAILGIARDVTRRKKAEESLVKAQFSLENVADAVHWLDRRGRIVDVGRSMCVRLGYSREELLTMSAFDITVDLSPDEWLDRWRVMKERGPVTFEREHRTKSGGLVPVEIWSDIVVYDGEEMVLAIARDISERKLAAEAVRESSELFSLFLRDTPIYSYIKAVTPSESCVLHASANYREMLGISSSDMVGKTMAELFPAERAARMTASDWAVVSTGQTLRFEEEFDGRKFTTIKFPLVRGEDTFLAGYTIDVTEAKDAEQALRASEQALKSYFDDAADAVYILDMATGGIKDCNRRACIDTGYSKDELLGMSASDLECGLTSAEVGEIHRDLRPVRPGVVQGLHRRKDGSIFPVEIRSSSLAAAHPDLAVAVSRDVTERSKMEESLRASKEYAENLISTANVLVVGLDAEGRVTVFNQEAERVTGYTRAELEGKNWFEALVPKDRFPHVWEAFSGLAVRGSVPRTFENPILTKSGEKRIISWQNSEVRESGQVSGTISFGMDVTERQRAEGQLREREEQLRQAQKMEAIGQLAGGIAHDFNNLLAAILGYCELLQARPELAGSSALDDLGEIRHAGERASALTRQILAFSRRQPLNPTVVSLSEVAKGVMPLLSRTLGEDVDISARLASTPGWVDADAHQFEQAIMNLAVNARDAMPSGGRLSLEVVDVELTERFCRSHPGTTPGSYVMLSVADNGVGMDKATLDRVFEPFFTTKDRDKGTGLGLSVVYGTVKQSNGHVLVESKPGKGTKVRIYLPRVGAPAAQEAVHPADAASPRGTETILLVEDEASLRRLAVRVLERVGYQILAAGSAAEALQQAESAGQPPDLLITDVVLPGGMQGNLLAHELTAAWPDLPVLYISGYPQDAIVHAGRLDQGVNFLQKPFSPEALVTTVRGLLDSAHAGKEAVP
jgi:two-component system cell cycle sensor histidine kinase/response regulator CckA